MKDGDCFSQVLLVIQFLQQIRTKKEKCDFRTFFLVFDRKRSEKQPTNFFRRKTKSDQDSLILFLIKVRNDARSLAFSGPNVHTRIFFLFSLWGDVGARAYSFQPLLGHFTLWYQGCAWYIQVIIIHQTKIRQ